MNEWSRKLQAPRDIAVLLQPRHSFGDARQVSWTIVSECRTDDHKHQMIVNMPSERELLPYLCGDENPGTTRRNRDVV
jgi:hypothetical protein